MADIATSILEVGSNRLILQDAEARTKINDMYITDTASGVIASFSDGADDIPVKSLNVAVEPVQSGSGDPSPSNVRPISGWSEAKVTKIGKNLLKNTAGSSDIFTVNTDGTISANGTGTSSTYKVVGSIDLPEGDYYISGCPSGGSASTYYIRMLVNGTGTGPNDYGSGEPLTLTKKSTVQIRCYVANGYTANSILFKPQIEVGSAFTGFKPYAEQTCTIDLDGTRYGGTLDVTTGVLTVDRAMVDLGSFTWTYYTSGTNPIFYAEPSGHRAYANGDHTDAICENYAEGITAAARSTLASSLPDKSFSWISGASGSFTVRDSSYTSAAAFKTAMDGVKLVYPLATPFTVQLSTNEVRTLLGHNNIWSDTGDTTVEYRADTSLYIKKLTGSTEDDMVADANIVSGQYFMVGNTLYKATANIASGGAITPNVNCTRKSLPEALNEINA